MCAGQCVSDRAVASKAVLGVIIPRFINNEEHARIRWSVSGGFDFDLKCVLRIFLYPRSPIRADAGLISGYVLDVQAPITGHCVAIAALDSGTGCHAAPGHQLIPASGKIGFKAGVCSKRVIDGEVWLGRCLRRDSCHVADVYIVDIADTGAAEQQPDTHKFCAGCRRVNAGERFPTAIGNGISCDGDLAFVVFVTVNRNSSVFKHVFQLQTDLISMTILHENLFLIGLNGLQHTVASGVLSDLERMYAAIRFCVDNFCCDGRLPAVDRIPAGQSVFKACVFQQENGISCCPGDLLPSAVGHTDRRKCTLCIVRK